MDNDRRKAARKLLLLAVIFLFAGLILAVILCLICNHYYGRVYFFDKEHIMIKVGWVIAIACGGLSIGFMMHPLPGDPVE